MLEILGASAAIAYLYLVTKRLSPAWPVYVLSSILYVPVFWRENLYADSVLQLYFVVVGLYAWWSWGLKAKEVLVVSWGWGRHAWIVVLTVGASLVLGHFLAQTPAGRFGYSDALISVGSVVATVLTAKRVLENWWYWIFVDSLATLVFGVRGLTVTMALYGLYTVLAVRGLIAWRAALRTAREG